MLPDILPEESFRSDSCPFCDILNGTGAGEVVARDDDRQLAVIKAKSPEGAIHWLALPVDHIETTEEMMHNHRDHFADLLDFAVEEANRHGETNPALRQGFTVKFHCGAYETIPHAKLHILSVE